MATGVHIQSVDFAHTGNKVHADIVVVDGADAPVAGALMHYTINAVPPGAWRYEQEATHADGLVDTVNVNVKSGDTVNVVVQNIDGTDYQYATDPLAWSQYHVA